MTHRPHAIYWAVSFAVAAILLYYSLHGIEWTQVWTVLHRAQPTAVGLALVLMSLSLFIRSLRWRVLLSAEGRVSASLAFWATSAGYLGNNVLPARAGEVIRTVLISRRSGMSKAFVLTTALSERVIDALALITISAIVLLALPGKPAWLAAAAKPFGVLGLIGVSVIALLPAFESFWFRIMALIPVPDALRDRAAHLLRKVLGGIRSFHDPSRLSRFLFLTAIIWCLDGIAIVVSAHAITLSISLPVAFLLLTGLGLGSALPSTPGYVGIYQFVAVSILVPFGFSKTKAVAFILLFQAASYVVVLLWGLIGLGKQRRPRMLSADAQTHFPASHIQE